ncbi:MAG: hypothetical protein GX149_03565 [Acholeplasmataceae bacterium]|jgi:hypothetical protein|nr:hypothetical protein [Acholeplasmataceae bacterium]
MSLIDILILIFVISFLGLIIYFRWIKRDKNNLGCHCYKRKSCNLKLEELKAIIEKNSLEK